MLLEEVKKILKAHRRDLSLKGARSMSVFGSVARNESTPTSDIDILVDFESDKGIFVFIGLKNYLKSILHCEVDLVSKNALHPALKDRILSEVKHVF